jgi:hypothetical protein
MSTDPTLPEITPGEAAALAERLRACLDRLQDVTGSCYLLVKDHRRDAAGDARLKPLGVEWKALREEARRLAELLDSWAARADRDPRPLHRLLGTVNTACEVPLTLFADAQDFCQRLALKLRQLPAPAAAEPAAGEEDPRNRPAYGNGEARLPPRAIAEQFGVSFPALESRLRRWRKDNPSQAGHGWVEVPDRGSRVPRYLYRLKDVRHIIDALSATDE